MSFEWIAEKPPRWNRSKEAIIGGAPPGIFRLRNYGAQAVIPGEWWRVEEQGVVLGYGWMDATWGDAEILLAVDPAQQRRGVGAFILTRLVSEAASRGLNYLYNVVPPAHPDREGLTRWLSTRGFERFHDAETLRRRV